MFGPSRLRHRSLLEFIVLRRGASTLMPGGCSRVRVLTGRTLSANGVVDRPKSVKARRAHSDRRCVHSSSQSALSLSLLGGMPSGTFPAPLDHDEKLKSRARRAFRAVETSPRPQHASSRLTTTVCEHPWMSGGISKAIPSSSANRKCMAENQLRCAGLAADRPPLRWARYHPGPLPGHGASVERNRPDPGSEPTVLAR